MPDTTKAITRKAVQRRGNYINLMKALELSPVENYARLFPEFRFKEKSLP